MDFLKRIENGWLLTKACFKVLKEDKEILAFPILSTIFAVLLTLILLFPMGILAMISDINGGLNLLFYLFIFGYLVILGLVSLFFKAAIITSATIRFTGENPSFSDGLKQPSKKIFKLMVWAVILVLANMFFSAIRGKKQNQSAPIAFARGAAAEVAETAWNLLTYFVIPIILFEELGIWDSIKESTSLFKKTWGENITAQFSVGGILFLIALVPGIIAILLIFSGTAPLILSGVLLFLGMVIIIGILSTSLNGILVAALYSYARKNKVPPVFGKELVSGMFAKKR